MAKGKYHEWLTPDGLTRLEGLARSGLSDEQIAAKMGVTAACLYNWQNRFVEIFDAIKRGKAPVDDEVENMLLKSAMGFEYEEIVTEITEVPTGKIDEKGRPIMRQNKQIKKIKKYSPPSNTAQIFWLKNRRPERWRERQEVLNNVRINGTGEALKDAFEKMRQEQENDKR